MKKNLKYYLLSIAIFGITFFGVILLLDFFFKDTDDRSLFLKIIISVAIAQIVSPIVNIVETQSGRQVELWWIFLKKRRRIGN